MERSSRTKACHGPIEGLVCRVNELPDKRGMEVRTTVRVVNAVRVDDEWASIDIREYVYEG